jgi:hypothetical protein
LRYFTARQFLACTGAHWGKRTATFWSKIERLKHARTEHFPKSGVFHHLFSRRLYRRINRKNLRNRRAHEIHSIKRRLAILDFVIANQQYEYLETEPKKVSYFCEKLTIDPRYLPARLYLGRKTPTASIRHFVDKFPMFFATPSPVVTFTYVHNEGTTGLSDFVEHLKTYPPLFRHLSQSALLYVARDSLQFPSATEIFDSLVKIPFESDIAQDLLRYFCVRKLWDERHCGEVTEAELIYRNKVRERFKGETFDELYRNWKNGRICSAAFEEKVLRNDAKRTIGLRPTSLAKFKLPGQGLGKSGAEGKTCALQARN